MKHMKRIKNNFIVIPFCKEPTLLMKDASHKNMTSSKIDKIKKSFNEDILEFTYAIEEKQEERLTKVQDDYNELVRCIELYNAVYLDNNHLESYEEASEKMMRAIIHIIDSRKEELGELMKEVDRAFLDMVADRVSFIKTASDFHKKAGELKISLEFDELFRSLIFNAETLINNSLEKYERQIMELNKILHSHYEEIKEAYIDFKTSKDDVGVELIEKDNAEMNFRTHNELKDYLIGNGFELERCNGSHQIFKNDAGEVRVLPKKKATQVLAPKTRRKIINGVQYA